MLFVIPWRQHWIIGTTDTDWDLDKNNPTASARDIDYLLDQVNAILRKPLRREDVVGVYAGLRPLVACPAGLVAGRAVGATAKLSREHTTAGMSWRPSTACLPSALSTCSTATATWSTRCSN